MGLATELDVLYGNKVFFPMNCPTIMEEYASDVTEGNVSSDKIEAQKLSRIFWMSVTWSIGATLNEKDRLLFNEQIKNLDQSLKDLTNIYDYKLDENLVWIKWATFLNEKWESHSE
ncbi:dynein heavy chain 2, axonemal [Trichonephila clavipes]|nr:dynein heavy chain 2, axonemal [Trichonephila clavipes]